MAISGSGTQADPWIVHDWSEFTEKKASGNNNYIRFADINIDENGDFDIEGTGISTDPFIVSTYREMLHCTGAHFIYQCELMESEDENNDAVSISPTEPRMYYYDDGESDIKYCLFNPRHSTIDFNDIQPNGYSSTFVLNPKMNFNGWTLKNAVFHDYGYFRRDMIVDPTAETPTFNDTAVLPLMTLYDDVFEFEVSTPDQSSEVNFDLVFREGRI